MRTPPCTRKQHPWHLALAAGLTLTVVAILAAAMPAMASVAGVPAAADTTPARADSARRLPADQLDALVAPVALYPDELLAQTLAASTYPLEIIQLQQWLAKHPGLKDKALADSVAKQPWDPSVQSMAPLPEVVKRLADDIQWTTELGNAFLSQQQDVTAAVQRMRAKAKDKGTLTTSEQQKVETKTVEQKQVIVIESTNPEVIYVPSYSPTVVYGPPIYPYPPIYYPPYPPGGMFISFTFGMMWGAAMWGGPCCHMGWGGGGTVIINNNNNFNRVSHYEGGRGGNNWQHNPEHRGGTPYPDQRTADRMGGQTRDGARAGDRSAGASQRPATSDRAAGAGQGQRSPGVSDRATGTGGIGERAPGPSTSDRAGGAGQGQRSAGVSDRSAGGIGGSGSGLSGGSRGYDGASARSNSSRGASSYGGGGMRGGGMGGGGRGGGGGRRR